MDDLVTGLLNERSAALGQLESHRHIRFTSSEIELWPGGRVRIVHVLYTDLELSTLSPMYNPNAVEQLIARIKAFQKAHHQLIRLRTLSAPSRSLATMQDPARWGQRDRADAATTYQGKTAADAVLAAISMM
jgi:hypothetical protein